ncbi:MAG: hypothetical protein IT374_05465 [Polyangiaceae bacterium]|nr:hypothetical protein [Polyangiaceae bacterium]
MSGDGAEGGVGAAERALELPVEVELDAARAVFGRARVDNVVLAPPSPAQRALAARVPSRRGEAASAVDAWRSGVETVLLTETRPLGALDPTRRDSDSLWVDSVRAVGLLDATQGCLLARAWVSRLLRWSWDDEGEHGPADVSLVGVAIYTLAFAERARGAHPARWRRLLEEAHAQVEHEAPPELSTLVYLRARWLWRG